MNWSASDTATVGKLIVKDWQVYQKQLAGYVAGLLLALGLVGMGSPLLAAAGGLLLLVLLIVVGMFAIASSIRSCMTCSSSTPLRSPPLAISVAIKA